MKTVVVGFVAVILLLCIAQLPAADPPAENADARAKLAAERFQLKAELVKRQKQVDGLLKLLKENGITIPLELGGLPPSAADAIDKGPWSVRILTNEEVSTQQAQQQILTSRSRVADVDKRIGSAKDRLDDVQRRYTSYPDRKPTAAELGAARSEVTRLEADRRRALQQIAQAERQLATAGASRIVVGQLDDGTAVDLSAGNDAAAALIRGLEVGEAYKVTGVAARDGGALRIKMQTAVASFASAAAPAAAEFAPSPPAAGAVEAAPAARVGRTVFLLDTSGSMINQIAPAKEELVKAVQGMQPSDWFGAVISQDDKATPFHPTLVQATPQNKRKFFTFLDAASTTGVTNIIPAVELALKMRPSVVWVITDGDFPDNAAVLRHVRQANRGGCRINTMLMGSYKEASPQVVGVLHDLARENGGACYDSTGHKIVPTPAHAAQPAPRANQPAGARYGIMRDEDLPRGKSLFREFDD